MISVTNHIKWKSITNWIRYWTNIIPDMAFYSNTFDFTNNQWTDKSGNDNHVNILCPYYAANGAWGWNMTKFLTDYGFTTYHEFVYTGDNMNIFSLSSTTANKQFVIQTVTAKLRIFHRAVNTFVLGTTVLNVGQKYKLLIQWIDKDTFYLYLDDSVVPEMSALGKNWAWQATWSLQGVNMNDTAAYGTAGVITETRIKMGTQTWGTMSTGLAALYYHQENSALLAADYSGNLRHMTLKGTAPTTKVYYQGVSPHLKNGFDVYRKQIGGYWYTDKLVPLLNDGTSIVVNTAAFPFRVANYDTDWLIWRKVAASTTKWNGCDIKIAFPYNVMTAAADAELGNILFTGTTPNQLDIWDLWDDHKELHLLFWNRNATDYTIDTNECLKGGYDLVLFKTARTDYVKILKYQYGYDTTPTIISASSLLYRMVNAADSFKLSSTHLLAVKLAGLYYLFFCGEDSDDPIKTRFADVERINHRNIFCNQTDTLWIYKKPLLPSHLATAVNTHLGLTDLEHLITTRNGIDYYNLDYEKYTLASNAINFNPSASVDTKYDIFDRRNVVGAAKEIWDVALLAGANFWTWNIDSGAKKMYEPTVVKYIQTAYSGKLYVRQDWDKNNRLIIPYLISFNTPLLGASKTAMFTFVDFPETVNEPAIVGDGVTNDATAINTSMGANPAVMLYEKNAVTLSEVKIPSNVELILADSEIKLGVDVNVNVIRNDDWVSGNSNLKLSGYGVSYIDGNGANQDRTAQDPNAYPNGEHYIFIANLFINVNNLRFRGVIIQDTMYWGWNSQLSDNILVEHVIMAQLASKANQDGIGLGFGTRNSICRYLTGQTADDFIASINYTDANDWILPEGTRSTQYLYYRDISQDTKLPGSGGGLIRIFDNDDAGIQNIEYQNIYTKRTDAGHSTGWFVNFSEIGGGRTSTNYATVFIFKNLKGSATANLYFTGGKYSNISVNKFWLDDPRTVTNNHIYITGGTFDIVDILSDLDYAPTNVLTQTGGTMTNFTHTEI